eukprot:CAMPEP_0175869828 /NCGR_PEP_ID=MMETSP0107_2-20121207/36201_1 /TAXON_ID=195067 ORGANISM="Goniomonas pacifica, Strain CCMP1869" /NCGR_SAMPLE_ID=MMETSP0107_2 /ASSEMBLY_ACC=CAM_ASM_000203 /LENGTH=45 /DNA_ID= /DNA_START= /DNA_END= /DNA_ORIENTATION=
MPMNEAIRTVISHLGNISVGGHSNSKSPGPVSSASFFSSLSSFST